MILRFVFRTNAARASSIGPAALAAATLLALTPASPLDAASPRVRSGDAPPARSKSPRIDQTLDGPVQMMVSLGEQKLRVFNKGVLVLTSRVSTGQPGFATPAGIYTILQKNRHHESNIYSGAPMPFMQRITWSGIALHEGVVPGHPASHGCIRLPSDMASLMWGLTRIGARVVVSRETLSPAPFAHPKLFKPEIKPAAPVAGGPPPSGDGGTNVTTGSIFVSPASASGTVQDATDPAQTRPMRAKAGQGGPVSVFVSRKEGRVFVRQNFEQIHEAPITIRDPDLPLGTHLITAMGYDKDGTTLLWNVISYPSETQSLLPSRQARARGDKAKAGDGNETGSWTWVSPPAASLERIEFGDDIPDMVSDVIGPGFSLIISDYGLGRETGKGTEFVVQPRG